VCSSDLSIISRIAVGRSVATVAELCFVVQWALLLREAGVALQSRSAVRIAGALMPLIVVAEASSWFAVLTTNNFFHAVENSLWTVAAVLATGGCLLMRTSADAASRRFLDAAIACGTLYVVFMVAVDVPMYVSRWLADGAASRRYLSIAEGLQEVAQRCTVVRAWSAWREDVTWLTLYFTVAVWLSIALPHAPVFRRATTRGESATTAPDTASAPGRLE
jgi:hypothetical protein